MAELEGVRPPSRLDVRPFATGLVAILFFVLVAGVFAWSESISMLMAYALIALAVLGAIYVGTGGRAWFGTREHPERLVGARLRFAGVEGHPALTRLPDAIVREWDGREYRAEFVEPPATAERDRHALLSARHAGYAVSRARTWRSVVVSGSLENGDGFIAVVRKA